MIPSETTEMMDPIALHSDTRQISSNAKYYFHSCPIFIASSGCSSDCESLKRQIRSEINAHMHWNHGYKTLTPSGVANLLSQTLYSRRSFPYYSFCILAGLEPSGHGHVHVYDAIGSHERVGIASAGNGKEMLQPILDRLFASEGSKDDFKSHGTRLKRDDRAVLASHQRVGLKLQPPVGTHVMCDCKVAEGLLVKGYRSVAEREISIGDNIVVCVIQREIKEVSSKDDILFSMQVKRYPLKQH
jgi:20S proteasome subunit beta 6